jgi:hypothetical protein
MESDHLDVSCPPLLAIRVGEGCNECLLPVADAPSQKQAVQILRTLVNKWMGGSDGSATLTLANGATFAQFATEQIVPASFEAVLAPGFDTEDAQAGLQVVNEVANLHIGAFLYYTLLLCLSYRLGLCRSCKLVTNPVKLILGEGFECLP